MICSKLKPIGKNLVSTVGKSPTTPKPGWLKRPCRSELMTSGMMPSPMARSTRLKSKCPPAWPTSKITPRSLALTAGLWALARLTPKLYKELARRGAMLAAGLADAARDAGVAVQVNAFGSLVTPFFTSAPVRDYDSALKADTAAYATFFSRHSEARYPRPRSSKRGFCQRRILIGM